MSIIQTIVMHVNSKLELSTSEIVELQKILDSEATTENIQHLKDFYEKFSK